MKVLVFDTETNGLPEGYNISIHETNKWPYMLQLSCILYDVDANNLIKQEDWIIKIDDDIDISEECTAINGITRLQCKRTGVSIKHVLEKFNKLIIKADLTLAHNWQFDQNIIMVECLRNNIFCNLSYTAGENRRPKYCSMKSGQPLCKIEKLSRAGKKYFKYPTLSELHEHLFNTTPNNTHDAMVDILICLRCFCKMKYDFDICKKNNKINKIFKNYEI